MGADADVGFHRSCAEAVLCRVETRTFSAYLFSGLPGIEKSLRSSYSPRVQFPSDESVSNQGERVLLSDRPSLVRDHLQRYIFARRYVDSESVVLDCACGSGYGSALLAKAAKQVTGVDISGQAIEYCRRTYTSPNLTFQTGTAEKLEFNDASLDCVCSIETIEHIPNPDNLIREASRVLKPGGIFLVSTPNRVNSRLASGEKPKNPFHLFEWSLAEFDTHLRGGFSQIQYFAQRVRSRNKFSWKYIVSKASRMGGGLDITGFRATPRVLAQMELANSWMPENFIAVCRK